MAGTIVQQEIIGSAELEEFAKAMGWNEREALGCLVLLWNGSQARKLVAASAAQIGNWCKITDVEERTKLIDTLCSEVVGLLKRRRLATFEIVGNKKEVRALKELKSRQKAGGAKTRAKWIQQHSRGEDSEQRAVVPTTLPSPPCPTLPIPSRPLPSQEHDPNQESFGFGEKKAERATISQAIDRALAAGNETLANQLRSWSSEHGRVSA